MKQRISLITTRLIPVANAVGYVRSKFYSKVLSTYGEVPDTVYDRLRLDLQCTMVFWYDWVNGP